MLDANEQEYWIFIFAYAALVLAIYPMMKDYIENYEKTERAMKWTIIVSFALVTFLEFFYRFILKPK